MRITPNGYEAMRSSDSKYHIGDKFRTGGLIAIVTEVSGEEYQLSFIDAKSHEEVRYCLKSAWYTNAELDNFKNYANKERIRSGFHKPRS
ncbi:MAG: hypothetical protein IJ655_05100 [Lachnospiraceae bacterium]|nr:hypothetical protein [Lachnospiraceae bacterium]